MAVGLVGCFAPVGIYRVALFVPLLIPSAGVFVVPPQSGVIQFACTEVWIPSNVSEFGVSVLRVGGHRGRVLANVSSVFLNGSTMGNDFWTLAWEDSDMSPKVINVLDLVHKTSENSTCLGVGSSLPPESKGAVFQQICFASADRLGGGVSNLIHFNTDTGTIVTSDAYTDISNECLIYATRVSSVPTDNIEVELSPCETSLPSEGTDFNFFPRRAGPLVWAPWEIGTRCVVRKFQYLPNESLGDFDFDGVLLWPDATQNHLKSICLSSSTRVVPSNQALDLESAISGAQEIDVSVNYRLLEIAVVGSASGSREWICKKGVGCLLDFPWTRLDPTDMIFSTINTCPPTCEAVHSYSPINASDLPYSVPRAAIDKFDSLTPIVMCVCRANYLTATPRFMGTLIVEGPSSTNLARCRKGVPSCAVLLDTVSPSVEESIRIMSDEGCQAVNSTPEGFLLGAKAQSIVLRNKGLYFLEDARALEKADPGLFKICWCRKSPENTCESYDAFDTLVGSFVYAGPYSVGSLHLTMGQEWVLSHVAGIGVHEGDQVRVMRECGIANDSSFLQAESFLLSDNSRLDGSEVHVSAYDFGVIDSTQIKAGQYNLCWCQPSRDTDDLFTYQTTCSNAEDFAAIFGSVTFSCPPGYANYHSLGTCTACLPWQKSSVYVDECVVDPVDATLLTLSLVWGAIAMFAIFDQVEIVWRRSVKGWPLCRFRGRSILIEDVSLEDGGTVITTHGRHYLRRRCGSFSVRFVDTGHYLLDATHRSSTQFRVVVVDPQRLRLLGADGCPVALRIDSSKGLVVMHAAQALLRTGFLGIFPCLSIFGTFAAGEWIARLLILKNEWLWILAPMFVCDIFLGLSLRCVWRLQRTPTALQTRLHLYQQRLGTWNPTPKPCEKGPGRAVTAFQLFDMHDFFQAFIRDRTMYYIDPQITRPLTAAHRLSYAERAGPKMVQWFVSHYWGTQFRNFCEAIARHAVTTVGGTKLSTAIKKNAKLLQKQSSVLDIADESWKNSSYWICTFSNNQYTIDEELGGGDHKKSSFYLALHSGVCKGTCMILDELAMPLTRSWCLFELLQTIQLTKHQDGFVGLLFCTATGVLNYGAASVAASLSLGARVAMMKLEDADATSPDDKNMINSLVQSEMGSFEAINAELRGYIVSALNVCKEHVDAEFVHIAHELTNSSLEDEYVVSVNDIAEDS